MEKKLRISSIEFEERLKKITAEHEDRLKKTITEYEERLNKKVDQLRLLSLSQRTKLHKLKEPSKALPADDDEVFSLDDIEIPFDPPTPVTQVQFRG